MTATSAPVPDRRRWAALIVVCLAQLMIVLDVTIVNVALPSIQHDLDFSQTSLTWVVNAFLVTFGSLLLLAGRLGDLAGRKGGFLAIIVTEFPEAADRARAMGAYVFVSVAGGSLGLLAGGLLTEALSWHWVFFVNLPIGIATFALGRALIRSDSGAGLGHGVDWLGSVLVTASLANAIYAIVSVTAHGWTSPRVLGFAGLAAVLMTAFIALEARIQNPILPLRGLRL